jgi:PAS domain S-box-containing protein
VRYGGHQAGFPCLSPRSSSRWARHCCRRFAVWLLGLAGSGSHHLLQILIIVAVPLILAAAWLRSGASSRRDVALEASTENIVRERDQLHAAVNNLPIGLVMFDAYKRVLIANDSYRRMYNLSREVTARGRHLREMLEERLATDNIEGDDRENYIERILKLVEQKDSSTRLVQLSDGRTFNILHHPVAGGGWIGTHEDVTEREKLNSQLAAQNELLRERELQLEAQNLKLDAALENMSQGLCMFDSEHRLVLCNEQYLDMYRLTPEDATPGMPLQGLLRRRMARGTYPKGPCLMTIWSSWYGR